MFDMQDWLAKKGKEQKRLYEKYGKPLEQAHKGEYVAISKEGNTLLGIGLGELLRQAVDTFGSDNFAIAKIGHDAVETWRQIVA